MTDPALLASLKQALDNDPRNGPLWLHYGELLLAAERQPEAQAALRSAIELLDDTRSASLTLIRSLRESADLAEALIRAEGLAEQHASAELSLELARINRDRGDHESARGHYEAARAAHPEEVARELEQLSGVPETEPIAAGVEASPPEENDWAEQFDWGDLRVTFADVAGLEDVKRQINLRIVAPFKNPEIYRAFERRGGGGLLLYGPPGCGKTFIARAAAGECGARFVSVSIHDIVDKYWGESEKLIHNLFKEARAKSPTVLFFDEFDALGSSRGRGDSQFWKVLVNQLLQEMDGLGGPNDDVLVFAATNMPWNVDSAFRRPGRFDRVVFVPPPDEAARLAILEQNAEKLPGAEGLDLRPIAKATPLFTGADLKAVVQRGSERALEASLASGKIRPVQTSDLEQELRRMNSTAAEWISTARNYARYSNDGGQYDELAAYLRSIGKL